MRLPDLEACYDAVPRPLSTTEEVGPFTLFRADEATGWQFYARPRLGHAAGITADDVRRVLHRQRELGLPQAIEWVDEVTPSLLPAVRDAVTGAHELELCPLLALPPEAELPAGSGRTRLLAPGDRDLPHVVGAVSAAFGERDEVLPRDVGRRPRLIRDGLLVVVGVYDAAGAVVGGGSAAPRGEAAELMGIAVVGPARRQGLGSAVTSALVAACRDVGVRSAFLSAASEEAASTYRRLGFERRGTACILGVEG